MGEGFVKLEKDLEVRPITVGWVLGGVGGCRKATWPGPHIHVSPEI